MVIALRDIKVSICHHCINLVKYIVYPSFRRLRQAIIIRQECRQIEKSLIVN